MWCACLTSMQARHGSPSQPANPGRHCCTGPCHCGQRRVPCTANGHGGPSAMLLVGGSAHPAPLPPPSPLAWRAGPQGQSIMAVSTAHAHSLLQTLPGNEWLPQPLAPMSTTSTLSLAVSKGLPFPPTDRLWPLSHSTTSMAVTKLVNIKPTQASHAWHLCQLHTGQGERGWGG